MPFLRCPQISPDKPTVAQRPHDAHTFCLRTVTGQACKTFISFAQQFATRYTIENRDQIIHNIESDFLDSRQKHDTQPSTTSSTTTATRLDDNPGRVGSHPQLATHRPDNTRDESSFSHGIFDVAVWRCSALHRPSTASNGSRPQFGYLTLYGERGQYYWKQSRNAWRSL
jgi:hypothetical protein